MMDPSRFMALVACVCVLFHDQFVVESIRVHIELDDVIKNQIRKEITEILEVRINQDDLKNGGVNGNGLPRDAVLEEKIDNQKQIMNELQRKNIELVKAFQTEKRLNRQFKRKLKSLEDDVIDQANSITSMKHTIISNQKECENRVENVNEDVKKLSKTVQKITKTVEKGHEISMNTCKIVPKSGVHNIYVDSMMKSVPVYCDQDTDDGGWIVFMRRQDGSENFTRSWQDYKTGFGNREGEFWAGNELLHQLTDSKPTQLRIDMEDSDGNKKFAQYEQFQIASEEDKYRLTVSEYSGTAGDGMSSLFWASHTHNGQQFSTFDSDNDRYNFGNCARQNDGGWWYNRCFNSLLTGIYSHKKQGDGITWSTWKGSSQHLKFVEMKIRQF